MGLRAAFLIGAVLLLAGFFLRTPGVSIIPWERKAAGPLGHLTASLLFTNSAQEAQEGRKLQALDQCDLAMKLLPDSAAAWSFLCWQLAFNFPATETDPESKWLWISWSLDTAKEGISRLADPEPLRFTLGMIYWDRILKDPDLAELYGAEAGTAARLHFFLGFRNGHLPSGMALSGILRQEAVSAARAEKWSGAAEAFEEAARVNSEMAAMGAGQAEDFALFFRDCAAAMRLKNQLDRADPGEAPALRERLSEIVSRQQSFPHDPFLREPF